MSVVSKEHEQSCTGPSSSAVRHSLQYSCGGMKSSAQSGQRRLGLGRSFKNTERRLSILANFREERKSSSG